MCIKIRKEKAVFSIIRYMVGSIVIDFLVIKRFNKESNIPKGE
jgi:hypothetical protein